MSIYQSKLIDAGILIPLTRDPRTEKLVRADQAIRSGPRTGPDADQRNFWKSGPVRTADRQFLENADQCGPRTDDMKQLVRAD